MIKPLLICLSVLLAVPNFINKDINDQLPYDHKERFYPELSTINSVDKLEKYVDGCAALKQIDQHSPEYALMLSYVISCRFYHGFSHWKLSENWIAAVGEKITGIGLSCKVQPESILQHPNAACSQQAMVMMEVLKRKNIDYRKVGFPHHYALEIKNGNDWYYYDPNMEPFMRISQRSEQSWKGINDNLKQYYDPAKHTNLSYQFGNKQMAFFGPVNEQPAKHLLLFQKITLIFSKILWCAPLVLLFFKKPVFKLNRLKTGKKFVHKQNLQPSFSA